MYKSVLVVDDVELSREIVKSSVLSADADTKVVCVDNAYAAINKMRSKKFDLVIMDIMMPNGDGFELLNMISQLSIATKIIVISALDRNVIDLMWKLGKLYDLDIISALEKPINAKQLTGLVTNTLNATTISQEQQVASFENNNIFDFPVDAYFEPQVDTSCERTIGIDVCGFWSSEVNSSLLSLNNLLPDVATLSDKKLYNQVLIGKFLQEYRVHFQSLPYELSFTLHIHPDYFDDSFVYGCLVELKEMNTRHKLNVYVTDIDDLENANDTLLKRYSQCAELGIGIVAGTRELTTEVITRAKKQSIKQLSVNSEVTSTLNIEKERKLIESSVSVAKKEQVDLLCCEVESARSSELLAMNGLTKQQGILFSPPVSADVLKIELLKQPHGLSESEV